MAIASFYLKASKRLIALSAEWGQWVVRGVGSVSPRSGGQSRTSLFIFRMAKKTHPFMTRSIGNSHNKIIVEFLQLVQR